MASHTDDPTSAAQYTAARTGAALRDASHCGRLQLSGADHLDFLHRMTTNAFADLEPGRGAEAVFIEQRARIIDLGVFYRGADSTLVLVGPGAQSEIPIWLDRFIFAEAIDFADITASTDMLECCGPQAAALVAQVLDLNLNQTRAGDLLAVPAADALWLARRDWDGCPGLRAIGTLDAIGLLREKLIASGAQTIGEEAWEILRVERGEPRKGRELTEDYNPWEAGLGRAIHMDKGCYIGQEVIARLDTYDKIKQHLVGLRLPAGDLPAPGQPLRDDRREVGRITSTAYSPTLGPIALAYVRRDACDAGTELALDQRRATVVTLPFAIP
jgi:folate-binding protein YgfZ